MTYPRLILSLLLVGSLAQSVRGQLPWTKGIEDWTATAEHRFNRSVDHYVPLPDSQRALVYLDQGTDLWGSRRGRFLLYDSELKVSSGKRAFSYDYGDMSYFEGMSYRTTGRKLQAFDVWSNAKQWTKRGVILHGVDELNRCLWLWQRGGTEAGQSRFLAVDHRTGETRWSVPLPLGQPTTFWQADDGYLYLVHRGLIRIDPATGAYWHVRCQTEHTRLNVAWEPVLVTALTFAISSVPGVGNITTTYNNYGGLRKHGQHSNVARSDSSTYFASLRRLYCVATQSGRVRWSAPLEELHVGRSFVELHGEQLYLFNPGREPKASRKYPNLPRVQRYDATTGTLLASHQPGDSDAYRYGDWVLEDDRLVLVAEQSILELDPLDLTPLAEHAYAPHRRTALRSRSEMPLYYVGKDGRAVAVSEVWGDRLALVDTRGNLHCLETEHWSAERVYAPEVLYQEGMTSEGYRLLYGRRRTLLIDRDGRLLRTFPRDTRVDLYNDRLYHYRGSRVLVYDIASQVPPP